MNKDLNDRYSGFWFVLPALLGTFIFIVIPIFDHTGKIHAHWSFRDITGSIAMNGLDERLLNDFCNAPLPGAPTIGKVVDDETLQRIY